MIEALLNCRLCARNCGVNRIKGDSGYCRAGKSVRVARALLHHWEEPCISGSKGSGTVFFSHCNLRCVFCQNHRISHQGEGKEISAQRLGLEFLELMERGAHNVNLVTPTHYVPQIIEGLDYAKKKGLNIPVIYNTNGYENVETVKSLKGYIDVYLPDIKYFDDRYAVKYSGAGGYFPTVSQAVKEMAFQVGRPNFDREGLIQSGVIIRHLMLPGLLFDSKKIIDYVYRTFGHEVYFSLMNQYTPMHRASSYSEINKPLNPQHYDALVEYCLSIGVKNAYVQGAGTVSEDYVPDFGSDKPLS